MSKLMRTIIAGFIALAIPVAGLAAIGVETAGASGTTTLTATFGFKTSSVTNEAACTATSITFSGTTNTPGATAPCTTSGTSDGVPTTGTATLNVHSDGTTTSNATVLKLNGTGVSFELTFGASGSCTITFKNSINLSWTGGISRYKVTNVATTTTVVTPTTGVCSTITTLLHHTADSTFSATFTFTGAKV